MTETIEWSFQRQAIASEALLRFSAGAESGGQAVLPYETWGDVIIHAMREASHLALVAKTAVILRSEGKIVSPAEPFMAATLAMSDFVVDEPQYSKWLQQYSGATTLGDADLVYFAARACCRKIYRTAQRTNLPPIAVFPLPGGPMGAVPGGYRTGCGEYCSSDPSANPLPEDAGWAAEGGGYLAPTLIAQGKGCDLGIAPIIVGAIVLGGIAAAAAAAWLGAEISEDTARVDIEDARATAKAVVALEIAKMQVAAGQPVRLPPDLLDWGEAEERNTSTWFKAAVGVAIGVTAAGAGALGYKLGSGPTGAA